MEILILKFHKQPIELSRYEFINQSYIEIIDELKEFLDFEKFNSDELILVLDFIGAGNYVTGTGIINKLVNLFTLSIPRVIYKTLRFLYRKIFRVDL